MATSGVLPRMITWLWMASLLALPFHRMWTVPGLGSKLQPPEVLFLALAGAAAVAWWRHPVRWRYSPIDLGVVVWCAANLLALSMTWRVGQGPLAPAVLEVAGVLYLAALYGVVRITATDERLARFASVFIWSATLAAIIGIAGFALSWAGAATRLATVPVTPVPYLGAAPRALAFTAHPGMLASILVLGIVLHIGQVGARKARTAQGWRRLECAVLVVLIVGLTVTLSKTMLGGLKRSLQQLGKFLRWFHPAKRLSRPVVEQMRHSIEMALAMNREVGASWEVLPKQAVGVLVRASLPGAMRIAEVDLHAGSNAELPVPGHLFAAVPRQGRGEMPWEGLDLLGNQGADTGASPIAADGQ